MLWCRREHDFLKDAPSPAPERHFARPAPSPRTPHSAREVSQKRPRGGRGLVTVVGPAPLAVPCRKRRPQEGRGLVTAVGPAPLLLLPFTIVFF